MAKRISVSDYRRLTRLHDALTALKQEIAPEKPEDLDEYDLARQKVHKQMDQLKKGIKMLNNLKDSRDLVEQKARLREQFIKIDDDVKSFGKILEKMAKKKVKKPQMEAHAARIKAGQEWMKVIREELMKQAQASSAVDLSGTMIDVQGNQREERKAEQKKKRAERRKNRRQRDGGAGDDEDWGGELELMSTEPMTEKEREFLQKVEQAREQEEEMLQLIMQGLDELQALAKNLNKLLKQQQALIDDVEERMDRVQEKLDGNNQRLDKILRKNRWDGSLDSICHLRDVFTAIAVFVYSRMSGGGE
eukprot:UN00702